MAPELATALRLGDNAMILGQQLSHWVSRSPMIELDIAFANQGLDLIGQANLFYELAGKLEGKGRSADDLAFLRDAGEFLNVQLVEQPNGDFAQTVMRQLLYVNFASIVFERMKNGPNNGFAGIAGKAVKEMAYHVRHAGEWVVRLGDGTRESHERCQNALDLLWPWIHELFAYDEVDEKMVQQGILPDCRPAKNEWQESLNKIFQRAGLTNPVTKEQPGESRKGVHSEYLVVILSEMQELARAHPGAQW